MAELTKFKASEVSYHIKHDLRELPTGKTFGNEAVDCSLSGGNYSLLNGRCQTAAEANKYRKQLEQEIFKYNRKNLVHAVEIVVQCPNDCPKYQKEIFFQETYKYICSTLPMGERCVFIAQVHVDERHYSPTGKMISKDHLHVMYIPAVKDTKHEGYEYRLCADQLTKKSKLREFHPGLQHHLDNAGITATVYKKNKQGGKTLSFSVSQLKDLTEKTGIALDHSLTVDELAKIINANILHEKQEQILREELADKERLLNLLEESVHKASVQIDIKDASITDLKAELDAYERQNTHLLNQITKLKQNLEISHSNEKELSKKLDHLEKSEKEMSRSHAWDHNSSWEHSSQWGGRNRDREEVHTW